MLEKKFQKRDLEFFPEKTILYDLGFRTGDVVKKINTQEIVSFDDLNLVDSEVKAARLVVMMS